MSHLPPASEPVSAYAHTVGDVLRQIRTELGWTRRHYLRQLHDVGVDITISTLATYEMGTRRLAIDRLPDLCRVLGTRPGDLITTADQNILGPPGGGVLLDLDRLARTDRPELAPAAKWAGTNDRTTTQLTADALDALAVLCHLDTATMTDVLRDYRA